MAWQTAAHLGTDEVVATCRCGQSFNSRTATAPTHASAPRRHHDRPNRCLRQPGPQLPETPGVEVRDDLPGRAGSCRAAGRAVVVDQQTGGPPIGEAPSGRSSSGTCPVMAAITSTTRLSSMIRNRSEADEPPTGCLGYRVLVIVDHHGEFS